MKLFVTLVFILSFSLRLAAAEPAFARTCVKATQTEKGRMVDVSIAVTSAHKGADKFALNLVRVFKLDLERSESVPRQDGYAIVDLFQDGSFASTLFGHNGRLVRACDDPTPLENGFGT